MLFDGDPRLADWIVRVLGKRPHLTAAQLLTQITQHTSYSIQGLYKELRALERSGVVVKHSLRYSLRIPWILELAEYVNTLDTNYISAASTMLSLPKVGKKQIRHFTSLLQLNNFWSQVLLFLIQQTKASTIYTYMPHPWYHLVYSAQEQQYIDAIHRINTTIYIINRGKMYLDTWVEKFWQAPHIAYSFHARPFANLPSTTYLNVIGQYVLTVKLGAAITREIDQLYSRTGSALDVNYPDMFQLFNQKVKATLWLEYNPTKATTIQRTFQRHFGVQG